MVFTNMSETERRKAMLKTMLKNGLTIIGLVILLAAYAVGFMSLYDFMSALTVVVFLGILTLTLEDVLRKSLSARELITWQYAVMVLFTIACDFLWVFFAACETWLQLFGRLIILLAATGGTVVWALFAYRVSIMSDAERKALKYTKLFRKFAKKFPQMTDDEVEEILETTLFCHLQDDSLEGGLCISQPFTSDFATYTELANRDDGIDYTSTINAIGDYISSVIAKREK